MKEKTVKKLMKSDDFHNAVNTVLLNSELYLSY